MQNGTDHRMRCDKISKALTDSVTLKYIGKKPQITKAVIPASKPLFVSLCEDDDVTGFIGCTCHRNGAITTLILYGERLTYASMSIISAHQ